MVKITLGIIGGGQLGSMLSSAAKKLNIKTVIFSNDNEAPAKNFSDNFVFGEYNDEEKIKEFIEKVDIVTFEFENIPFETLDKINKIKKVLPHPSINKIIQHRLHEKDFINKCNLRTTLYDSVKNDKELKSKSDYVPGIIKTCTLGYDGKGQYTINSLDDIEKINLDYSKEYIIEKFVNLKKEISVIITRFGNEKYEIYEPIENIHEDQILKNSKIPAEISKETINKSKNWAKIISEELNYIGTLCVNFYR
jgi:Phosphoribosylaminoimidazole carboxylase (NCAIR synthetase)